MGQAILSEPPDSVLQLSDLRRIKCSVDVSKWSGWPQAVRRLRAVGQAILSEPPDSVLQLSDLFLYYLYYFSMVFQILLSVFQKSHSYFQKNISVL